ncbi:S8 family serine peptidase [Bdellovibrio reynosensis]|uniref:S8 family serine peptidase n=1 Tax=Bdellovibrio reynosensis TaxID=2835041 RepID=A0ABY4C5Z8_9BACT|nr:S8 family serine peptidase [Bdellovibrio reynosensis]UOF00372.1 S8 family serine peptidase [Bdellovibrio reynosensis]
MKKSFLFLLFLIFQFPILSQAGKIKTVPGEFVVKLKPQLSVHSPRHEIEARLKSTVISTIPEQNIVVIRRPVFELQEEVVKILSENPWVDIAEPNYIYKASRIPNDPMLGLLWGLRNIGQSDIDRNPGVRDMDIDAEKAWDITTGSKKILVAIIDSGVEYTHPDLVENIWVNEKEENGKEGVDDDNNGIIDDIHGANFVKADKPTGDPLDDYGHGTHVAGTLGAIGDDAMGIVGVAWHVTMLPVKFLDEEGEGTLDAAIKAINYANKMGAKILSNSWGGGGYSANLKLAIEESHKANALFVASAGNDENDNDKTPSYPANYEVANVISVAAITNKGQLADFSNYGRYTVDVAAPGVNIYSSYLYGDYTSMSGTSMAVPHVSGIAALMWSDKPDLLNTRVRSRIMATSKRVGNLKIRRGIANAYYALTNTEWPDPADPANWSKVNLKFSTAHPYAANTRQEFIVDIPQAKRISLYFSLFNTEADFDKVELFDQNGTKVTEIFGRNNGLYTAPIEGHTVKVVFTSDGSVNRYGFDLTKAAWQ